MTPSQTTLEVRRLGPGWKDPLARFLSAIEQAGDDRWFRPHPFTDEAVENLVGYRGLDLYFVMTEGEEVLGYGLLRGWDEGYDVPSLGVAIHPRAQGRGLGRALMEVLHAAAARRGARRVRLRVHPDNTQARRLYERLGYQFQSSEGGLLVGIRDLEGDTGDGGHPGVAHR